MTFIDSFEATVDRSTNLSDVEKFSYLLSYLEKDALHTTSGMPITNAILQEGSRVTEKSIRESIKVISA